MCYLYCLPVCLVECAITDILIENYSEAHRPRYLVAFWCEARFGLQRTQCSVQFSHSVCLTLCDPMDYSMLDFPIHHQLPGLAQTHVHPVGDAIQPSHPLSSPSLPPSIFPSIRVFQIPQCFTSGGQTIGVSASASVLPINIQDWFPLGGTGLISLLSKGLSRIFSNTTGQKHQFFGSQLSL